MGRRVEPFPSRRPQVPRHILEQKFLCCGQPQLLLGTARHGTARHGTARHMWGRVRVPGLAPKLGSPRAIFRRRRPPVVARRLASCIVLPRAGWLRTHGGRRNFAQASSHTLPSLAPSFALRARPTPPPSHVPAPPPALHARSVPDFDFLPLEVPDTRLGLRLDRRGRRAARLCLPRARPRRLFRDRRWHRAVDAHCLAVFGVGKRRQRGLQPAADKLFFSCGVMGLGCIRRCMTNDTCLLWKFSGNILSTE